MLEVIDWHRNKAAVNARKSNLLAVQLDDADIQSAVDVQLDVVNQLGMLVLPD